MVNTTIAIDEKVNAELIEFISVFGIRSVKDAIPYLLLFFYGETGNNHKKKFDLLKTINPYDIDVINGDFMPESGINFESLMDFRRNQLFRWITEFRGKSSTIIKIINQQKTNLEDLE